MSNALNSNGTLSIAERNRIDALDARDRRDDRSRIEAARDEFLRTGVIHHTASTLRIMLEYGTLSKALRREVEFSLKTLGPCTQYGCPCCGSYVIRYPKADREAAAANYYRID